MTTPASPNPPDLPSTGSAPLLPVGSDRFRSIQFGPCVPVWTVVAMLFVLALIAPWGSGIPAWVSLLISGLVLMSALLWCRWQVLPFVVKAFGGWQWGLYQLDFLLERATWSIHPCCPSGDAEFVFSPLIIEEPRQLGSPIVVWPWLIVLPLRVPSSFASLGGQRCVLLLKTSANADDFRRLSVLIKTSHAQWQ